MAIVRARVFLAATGLVYGACMAECGGIEKKRLIDLEILPKRTYIWYGSSSHVRAGPDAETGKKTNRPRSDGVTTQNVRLKFRFPM